MSIVAIIAIATGILGAVVLIATFHQRQRPEMQYFSKEQGFADLLNYAAVVDDGVVVCKSGAFIAAWIYKGLDSASAVDPERELQALRLNQAFAGLGNGWMLHVDAVRRPTTNYSERGLSFFPDPVTRAIDEERRRLFERLGTMYEGRFVITLTWHPPVLMQRKFIELMFDDDTGILSKTERTKELIKTFKQQVAVIESRLSAAVKLVRLKGRKTQKEDGSLETRDELLEWLNYAISGKRHPVLLPSNPVYIDGLLAQEFHGGVVPKIGANFITAVTIEGFPMESHPGILNTLSEIPCEYRWSSRYIFLDQHTALNQLDKYRKKWKQKVRGFFDQVFNTNTGAVNQDAVLMVADAEAAIAEINSGLVSSGFYTSCIILMGDNRKQLEQATQRVEKSINALGFAARVETINTIEAYLGSLPGHGTENVRRPSINTLNLADLLPSSTIWTGNDRNPCPMYPPMSPPLMHCVTNGATPFRLNLHIRDLGHSLMFGPTRAGKSTHLGLIAAQFRRYSGMSIFAFDKGMSMYPLTKAVGGLHFSVASDDSNLAYCPLQFLETKGDRAWAMNWIDSILALNGVFTTPEQRNLIGRAIMSMHESGARTLSEFSATVQDNTIREALKQYTIDGMMGHLLDAEEDGLKLSDFTTFEIEELMNLGEKYALPVLMYLFRRIERSLRGQPAAILCDEAWIMLGHPVFRDKIREWLKAYAKKNCLLFLATQNLSDAAGSGILDVIVESTATKIFLPNVYARDEETAALYRRMGLNARQIEILAGAVPKRHYYCVSEQGNRLYELALGPLSLAFVGATDKESIAQIKNLEQKHGAAWVYEWLAQRGLKLADYLVEG